MRAFSQIDSSFITPLFPNTEYVITQQKQDNGTVLGFTTPFNKEGHSISIYSFTSESLKNTLTIPGFFQSAIYGFSTDLKVVVQNNYNQSRYLIQHNGRWIDTTVSTPYAAFLGYGNPYSLFPSSLAHHSVPLVKYKEENGAYC